ncbi:MAG: gamma-glutamyltranspeptidase [Acidobacteria bacterium]|nr:gamma-glutamyltranspeptidase [Acidobacteriota bacterium]
MNNTQRTSARRHCAIATPHALATEAASDVIRSGGNAIDAALSAAFVLSVVYPHNTSLGGDLIALVRQPDGTITTVNSSGPASQHVDLADFRTRFGDSMPVTGVDTITVPGAIAGLATLHAFGASRAWEQHLSAAYHLAANGAPVASSLEAATKEQFDLVRGDPGLAALLAPLGEPLRTGERFIQPALAGSLRTLAEDGPSSFYGGQLGRDLVGGLAALGAQLDISDLGEFSPRLEEPLRATYGPWDIWTSGPNSQGFLLLEVLGALETLGPSRDPLGRDADILSELFRLATNDRDTYLAEANLMTKSVSELLAPARLAGLGREAVARTTATANKPAPEKGRPKGDTVAVVTVDGNGRAVCLIQSVFHAFGAAILEPSTGIVMHNRGSLFSLSSDSVNQLAPRRRPAHTLMPVMVTRGDAVAWVAGTMGGKAQPQILTQVLLRLFAGEAPGDAVAAPRWVVGGLEANHVEEKAYVESPIAATARRSIQSRLSIVDLPQHDEITGHSQVVGVLDDGSLVAASDPRSDGRGVTVEISE